MTAWLEFHLGDPPVRKALVRFDDFDDAAERSILLLRDDVEVFFEWDSVVPYDDRHPPPDPEEAIEWSQARARTSR